MICASEQSVIVHEKIYDAVKAEFIARGCYVCNKEENDKLRKVILIDGALNAKIVGQKPVTIAKLAGFDVPENTKVLISEAESVNIEEPLAHEKLSPVLAMYKSSSFEDQLAKARQLVHDGGHGHTSSLYINLGTGQEKIKQFESAMETCRILINTPAAQGGIGDIYNFEHQKKYTSRKAVFQLHLQN